jgi:hypothetical protein
MGTISYQGPSPYPLPLPQFAKAYAVGELVRLVLHVQEKGETVEIHAEMLPKVADEMARALIKASSETR